MCKDNVKVNHVKESESFSTGIAQIIVSDTGENQIVIVAGANTKLSVEDVDCAKDVIGNADVIVLQLETSEDVAIKACQLCRGVGLIININFVNVPSFFFLLLVINTLIS